MFQVVDFCRFCNEAQALGRYEQLGGHDGCRLLFDYITELEDSTGEAIELDIIAFCCDYAVMSIDEFLYEYYAEELKEKTQERIDEAVEAFLEEEGKRLLKLSITGEELEEELEYKEEELRETIELTEEEKEGIKAELWESAKQDERILAHDYIAGLVLVDLNY